MGMFDYVRYSAKCQFCGEPSPIWQSKDSDCTMSSVDIHQITRFYDYCHRCGGWNEYEVITQNKITKVVSNHSRCKPCSNLNSRRFSLPITCKVCKQNIVGCKHIQFCSNRCQDIDNLIPINE